MFTLIRETKLNLIFGFALVSVWLLPLPFVYAEDHGSSGHSSEQQQEENKTQEEGEQEEAPIFSPAGSACDPPVPVALELFKSPTPLVRKFGAERLILCKFGARPAIGGLKKLLSDPDLEVRIAAARALAGTKSSKMPVAELLSLFVTNLSNDNLYVRRKAASGLAVITDPPPLGETYRISVPEGRYITRAMVKSSKDPDGVIQAAIAHTFGNLKVASVLPILRGMVDSSYWQVRRESIIALGRFEAKARHYSPAVAKALRSDSNYDVQKAAADTLLSFGNGNSVAEVKKCAISEGKAPFGKIHEYCMKLNSTYNLD